MENKDYRESIGKKLAQALTEDDFADLEDLSLSLSLPLFCSR